MDRAQLADFLRTRREALQPEDVGLPRGARRRTRGLRREEAAALCGMSTDYYSRIEQQRGPQPSESMLAAMARGLHLSLDERDHLFRTAGHNTPGRTLRTDHVSPGIMRILDRLGDTPAQVLTDLCETLRQTPPCVALLGDMSGRTGLDRSAIYRWFTDPEARSVHPEADHAWHGRAFASDLRAAYSRQGPGGGAEHIVESLLARGGEFTALWGAHEIGVRNRGDGRKRILHPQLGLLDLHCQVLHDLDQAQSVLVFTATPGTESYEKLQMLSVVGESSPGR
ncbi:helix-turn-helix transcriptional regulator [Streptomyces tsukubensis]|uniref:Transcriptional regulator n=1 Tax=Streptomyces tsukubensis TaxID=83656 RepID=A0A1V4A013_9ACTN|nr:helix-turn-helix transcriptional regulator [Streptomyces tsukubensis]OON72169.1 transcriptional regulator [Streptomyces tsukubensis]QFR97096.1 helix-turn-helix domain-containing protein [Streptomyces tsukubensis]